MKTLIAIDPGMNGGIVSTRWEASALPMPKTLHDIDEEFSSHSERDIEIRKEGGEATTTVYLENVHSMPGQGVASSFKFGRGFGQLEGLCAAYGFRVIYVSPQKWQKGLGLLTNKGESKTQHKNKIKAFAQQRYPHIKVTLATADALAILEYAKLQEK